MRHQAIELTDTEAAAFIKYLWLGYVKEINIESALEIWVKAQAKRR